MMCGWCVCMARARGPQLPPLFRTITGCTFSARCARRIPMVLTHSRLDSSGGTPNEASEPIPFAGSILGAQRHVCAFFHNSDEEYRVLLPFIKDGFERGEKAFHIVDPKLRSEHLLRLASAGIDVEAAENSGHFELRSWADAYLRDGHLDQDRKPALNDEVLEGGIQQ